MTADSLYNLIINFIIKDYRIILYRTDINIRSGSVWLILTQEVEYSCSSYYILSWDDPDKPGDRHRWDHEMDISKYDY